MAVCNPQVCPGFLRPVLTQIFFPELPNTFLTEVRGESKPEKRFAPTEDQNHNHRVMSPTHSPLIHMDGLLLFLVNVKFVVCKYFEFGSV